MHDRAPGRVDLVDPDLYSVGDPHAVWRWLRANDPVHWHPPAALPGFWALTRYHDIRAVCRDTETFSSAQGILLRPESHGPDPGGGRTLALTDPPQHGRLRAAVDRWFATPSVRSLEPFMRACVDEILGRVLEAGRCDFVADVAAPLPVAVICRVMGVPDGDRAHLLALTSRAFGADDAGDRSVAHLEILDYFDVLTADRIRHPRDDMISALASAQPEGRRLTADEIILNCDNLLVGGTENVRLAAAGGMDAFLLHRDQWAALTADRSALPSAIEEVLRWTSPATHLMRTATRPTTLGSRRIEAGDRVTMWIPSADRDEQVFTDADQFRISREPNRHLALGSGEHLCIGGHLARIELRVLFEGILDRLSGMEPDGQPERLRSIVVHGFQRLPVRVEAR
jgi:cytochrome P450